jgi:hypothetical protein
MEAGFFSRPSSESPASAGELKIERAFPMAASSAMLFEMFFLAGHAWSVVAATRGL